MRLPSLPGPGDVVDVVTRAGTAVDSLLDAVPRLVGLLGEAERLVEDARGLLARIEVTRATADEVVARTAATVDTAEAVLGRAGRTLDDTDVAVRRATAAVDAADPVLTRITELTERLAPPLTTLQPSLERLAETTAPREVDALISLIDTMPLLARRLEDDVLPVLRTLDSVAPDIHDLLDVSRELNLMIAKLPGMGMIKRRVDDEHVESGA